MDFSVITVGLVTKLLLLLLIGMGPKIALVPYVETTKDMDKATKAKVMHKMLEEKARMSLPEQEPNSSVSPEPEPAAGTP